MIVCFIDSLLIIFYVIDYNKIEKIGILHRYYSIIGRVYDWPETFTFIRGLSSRSYPKW